MDAEGYIAKMQEIQNYLLKFLEGNQDVEENHENLTKILTDQKIRENKHELKLFLRLINTIGNNHRRVSGFISKIEQLLREISKEIKNSFSNLEIFELFKKNKRILLFLIKEEIVKFDENIFSHITEYLIDRNYPQYFAPEIKPFLTDEFIKKHQKYRCDQYGDDIDEIPLWIVETKKELPENFEQKRLEGENDNQMCELIRKHKTKEFIIYMN